MENIEKICTKWKIKNNGMFKGRNRKIMGISDQEYRKIVYK